MKDKTMTTEHSTMSKTRRAAIAAVLIAGLSGAVTIVGTSVASSDPGSAPAVTQDTNDGTIDPEILADCEKFAEENGMGEQFADMAGDHQGMGDFADMMSGQFADMMSGSNRMGA